MRNQYCEMNAALRKIVQYCLECLLFLRPDASRPPEDLLSFRARSKLIVGDASSIPGFSQT